MKEQTIREIISDYFSLPGVNFLEKYPQVDKEHYWNGENGEGLMEALDGYRLIEGKVALTESNPQTRKQPSENVTLVKPEIFEPQKPEQDKVDPDRLTYFENECVKNGLPAVDEMVMHNANVHLECLSDTAFMLIVENGRHHWHLNINSRGGRAKIEAFVYEGDEHQKKLKGGLQDD